MYGVEEHFPSDVILFKDISKVILPPAQHTKRSNEEKSPHYDQKKGVCDQKTRGLFNKSREDVTTKMQHEFYNRDQQFMATLKKYTTYQRCHLTSH